MADNKDTTNTAAEASRARTKGLMAQQQAWSTADYEAETDNIQSYIEQFIGTIREERKPQTSTMTSDSELAPTESPLPEYRPGSVANADLSDKEILAMTLQAEAGGEGYEGMLAAGAVIDNRAKLGNYGEGIKGVILKPGQFSAWNGVTGYAKGEGALDMDKIRPSADAMKAAEAILTGDYSDPTGGATHYYNDAVANPAWGEARAGGAWKRIGNHLFGFAG